VKQVTTYVGIDAQKKGLFIAMLMGTQAVPVTCTVPNEPNAVRRLVPDARTKGQGTAAYNRRTQWPCRRARALGRTNPVPHRG
jgi:hypothetical protein